MRLLLNSNVSFVQPSPAPSSVGPSALNVNTHPHLALEASLLQANNLRPTGLSENGTVTTIAGSSTGFLDGAGVVARFASPTDVAILDGIIYVADLGNHRIRKVYKK